MAIKIRLRRMGRKKQAHYRIVVAEGEAPRDGRFVESLGYFKPLSHPARVVVDMERVDHWLGQGAQPSDTVASIIRKVRRGGDASLAVGEIDKEAEKVAKVEALAAKRKAEAEADAAQAAEKAAEKKAEAKAEEAAPAEEEAKAEEAAPAEAEAKAEEAAPAEEKAKAEEAEPVVAEAPAEEPAAEAAVETPDASEEEEKA